MKLYATSEVVNGNEYVIVDPGSAEEANWRARGYRPEGDGEALGTEPRRRRGRPPRVREEVEE